MGKIYKTARGTNVDMDMLRLANESTIAVGNMKVNARGDQLGKGGRVVRTRAQVMAEYHKLNTPVALDMADDFEFGQVSAEDPQQSPRVATPVAVDLSTLSEEPSGDTYVKPRGSFAESIAKEAEVKQELLEPAPLRNVNIGVTRI